MAKELPTLPPMPLVVNTLTPTITPDIEARSEEKPTSIARHGTWSDGSHKAVTKAEKAWCWSADSEKEIRTIEKYFAQAHEEITMWLFQVRKCRTKNQYVNEMFAFHTYSTLPAVVAKKIEIDYAMKMLEKLYPSEWERLGAMLFDAVTNKRAVPNLKEMLKKDLLKVIRIDRDE